MQIVYDEETKTWKEKEEPYATIDVGSKEDLAILENAVKLRKSLKELGPCGDLGCAYEDIIGCARLQDWVSKVHELMALYCD